MKLQLIAFVTAASLGLCACGHGHSHTSDAKSYQHYAPGDGAIDLAEGEVVIRAGGQPQDARVGDDGSLQIGAQRIETSVQGHAALSRYFTAAVAFREHAVALGIAGAHFGIETAQHVLKGLFDGTAEKAGEEADRGAAEIQRRALEICDRLNDAFLAQTDAANAVAEFKPFAVISAKQIDECRSGLKPDSDADSDSKSDADSDPTSDEDSKPDSDATPDPDEAAPPKPHRKTDSQA